MTNDLTLLPLQNGKARMTRTGLILDDTLNYEEWESIGASLSQINGAIQWMIGDWINFGERKYGEMYAQAISDTDYDYGSLRDMAWIADRLGLSRRRDNLSWGHHREVAPLEIDDQDKLLDLAEANHLSVHNLRAEVRRFKNGHSKILPEDTTIQYPVTIIHDDMVNYLEHSTDCYSLVIADPPYNVTSWDWDKIGTRDYFMSQTEEWLNACITHTAPDYHLFWFCSPSYMADIEYLMRSMQLPIQSRLVWHRRNMAMGSDAKTKFIDTWECIFHVGNYPLNFSSDWDESRFDVQTFAVPQTNFNDQKLHPTQKPLELIRWLVRYGSYIGDSILDPFAGSGVTGHAALLEGRACTLIEREREYIDVIQNRLQQG